MNASTLKKYCDFNVQLIIIPNKALESCNLINTYVKVLDMTCKPP